MQNSFAQHNRTWTGNTVFGHFNNLIANFKLRDLSILIRKSAVTAQAQSLVDLVRISYILQRLADFEQDLGTFLLRDPRPLRCLFRDSRSGLLNAFRKKRFRSLSFALCFASRFAWRSLAASFISSIVYLATGPGGIFAGTPGPAFFFLLIGLCEAFHGTELVTALVQFQIPNIIFVAAFTILLAGLASTDDAAIVFHQQRADVVEDQPGAAAGIPLSAVIGDRDPHVLLGTLISILVAWEKNFLCVGQHLICDV